MVKSSASYQIVLKPVLTEKSTEEQERCNSYRFEVASGSNRIEIAQAVEDIFEVKVVKVNTLLRPGKMRRRGMQLFRTPARKIAIIHLAEGERIDLY